MLGVFYVAFDAGFNKFFASDYLNFLLLFGFFFDFFQAPFRVSNGYVFK